MPDRPEGFDWPAARARLARTLHALDAATGPTPAEVGRILAARAAQLAAPAEQAAAPGLDMVVFRAGAGLIAIAADQATAVLPVRATRLPGLSPLHLGILLHRGAVWPLVDIAPLLGVARESGADAGFGILCASQDRAIAIAADSIEGLQRCEEAALARIGESDRRHPAILGLLPGGAIALDVPLLLRDARFVVDDQPVSAWIAGSEVAKA